MEKRLILQAVIIFSYFLVELIVGIIIGSNVLKADAFHMLSDFLAIIITLVSNRISKKKTSNFTYGLVRSKVMGGVANGIFMVAVCINILLEAIETYIEPDFDNLEDNINLLIIVGSIGLLINIIGIFLFHNHHEDSNIQGLFIHILSDLLSSVAVVVTGITIKFADSENVYYMDPSLSIGIAIMITYVTIPFLKNNIKTLMQYVPSNIDMEKLNNDISALTYVREIHELHVWKLDAKTLIGSIHINLSNSTNLEQKIIEIKEIFHTYGVHSTTIQPEFCDTCIEPTCNSDCNTNRCCLEDSTQVL